MEKDSGNAARRKVSSKKTEYVEGNTVRRMEAAPDIRRKLETEEERQRSREQRKRQNRAKRNQQRALQMNKSYVFFLTFAVGIVAMTAAYTVQLQADINTKMDTVASLKSQVEELKADNDSAEKKLESTIDLDSIKDIAINQLGMVYPAKDQIVYYDIKKSDYMNQYEDIPSK